MSVEVVNPLTLPSLSLQERRSLPECAAVYFVLNSNEILYIGGTVNLSQRWFTHHRWHQLINMGDDIRIAWLECSEPALVLEIEAALIEHFQPTLNRTRIPDNRRITAFLPPDKAEFLEEWAKRENRAVGNLAATILLNVIDAKQLEDANNTRDSAA
ncbi:GIY-YIG nuclease family protein [Nostoc sp. 'Peltigera malacea cyanobiont' DB3992]|uniref:GIY-YIG nuclease family protein n=1 Tax=Nostoc sp. 'Peltigera malacea cyanobiont' DB3992 TaxID=1206980 RepID=UPI000C048D19|nr:GIY-YIG nuclease family protein [Nostoc sp. 'Peltigera malacea cyanobiont' DB3992]PHM07385.1 hypothetical protein CK516_27320 [Nostoc sp. 'Peltigera malacea cyanobiont' DB3992]